jgi:hypothetical protein
MNSLESHLARERMEPSVVMDALQKFNVISDLAVHPRDVAECDAVRAVEWLTGGKITKESKGQAQWWEKL